MSGNEAAGAGLSSYFLMAVGVMGLSAILGFGTYLFYHGSVRTLDSQTVKLIGNVTEEVRKAYENDLENLTLDDDVTSVTLERESGVNRYSQRW